MHPQGTIAVEVIGSGVSEQLRWCCQAKQVQGLVRAREDPRPAQARDDTNAQFDARGGCSREERCRIGRNACGIDAGRRCHHPNLKPFAG